MIGVVEKWIRWPIRRRRRFVDSDEREDVQNAITFGCRDPVKGIEEHRVANGTASLVVAFIACRRITDEFRVGNEGRGAAVMQQLRE